MKMPGHKEGVGTVAEFSFPWSYDYRQSSNTNIYASLMCWERGKNCNLGHKYTIDQTTEKDQWLPGAGGGDRTGLQRGTEEFFRVKELFYLTVPDSQS